MDIRNLYTAFFSPTGTTRRTVEAIARGFVAERSVPCIEWDRTHTTHPTARQLGPNEVIVLAAPVYGGHIAPTARQRLETIRGDGTPAVLVVVYGNRAFEKALVELSELACRQGFMPVGAAACIGEHSYSTEQWPIATGRPDATDLSEAEAFGRRLARHLATAANPLEALDVRNMTQPPSGFGPMLRFIRFVLGYRRRQKRHPKIYLPQTDAARCIHCGRCAAQCPVEAIPRGNEELTDGSRCIRCCSCVKGCPVGARRFETPFSEALSRNFQRRKPNVYLLSNAE